MNLDEQYNHKKLSLVSFTHPSLNKKKKAAQELRQQNVICVSYLCISTLEKIVKGQEVIEEEPLFSRYLFAQFNVKKTNLDLY